MQSRKLIAILLSSAFIFSVTLTFAKKEEAPIPEHYEQITFTESEDLDPAVSPDGKTIAFASDRTGNFDIYFRVLGQAGESQKTFSPKDERHPSWAGDALVYQSDRTGNWNLFKMNLDGGPGEVQWTSDPGQEKYPSVHPDTGKVLFVQAEKKGFFLLSRRDRSIMVAEDNPRQASEIAQGLDPRWSPEGSHVVFSSRRTKNFDIWLVPADGGAAMQLTTHKKHDESPCFSPDGEKIVFTSERTGNFDLWVMNADGSGKMQLTTYEEDETAPCWGPDGKIYFVLKEGRARNIYAIDAP